MYQNVSFHIADGQRLSLFMDPWCGGYSLPVGPSLVPSLGRFVPSGRLRNNPEPLVCTSFFNHLPNPRLRPEGRFLD
ncbi:hypothetical protein Acr_13g0006870 [Actinidia rufa]|uniref:Uncharacterized protein n=1 Tax=Actinidia rufa TaxID=165716 RepID=A0A7J0FLL6_9ERIC|nr:hypothetical protein Acr_13g0006870 [Actinidia rufa]